MTGAHINFKTLRIDNCIGDGFIIERIATGEAFAVHLKSDVLPAELANFEAKIRKLRSAGETVLAEDIDSVEAMAENPSKKILSVPPAETVRVERLKNYHFAPTDMFGNHGGIINKNMPR